MLFADIDADGWVKIIGAGAAGAVTVLGACTTLAVFVVGRIEKLRAELKVNTAATETAAAEAEKAHRRAGVAAAVVAETSKEVSEVKQIVNGRQDVLLARITKLETDKAALEVEVAKYRSPRP